MSKRTGLEYPKLDNEIIKVKNFLVIQSVKKPPMECGDITVLVGEQAAGKSILAKLQYFFWKYQSDLFDAENSSEKTIAVYSRGKVDEFFELFSITSKNIEPFKIEYKSNDIEICIERTKTGHKPKITTSPFLEKLYTKVKKHRIKHSESERVYYRTSRAMREKKHKEYEKLGRAYHKLRIDLDKFNASIPDVLYVPASRSFFSTIENNVFAFLAKGKESLDPLIVQFGEFYETAKSISQRPSRYVTEEKSQRGEKIIKDILKGVFIQRNNKDIISTDSGEVELRNASSGQQESLPLILSLLYFPSDFRISTHSARIPPHFFKKNKNQLIIIEEPEAHLFPTAQRVLVKMIADVVRKEKCKVMIATHSPYIPACINNEIKIAENEDDSLDVTAYHISDGTLEDIYYKKYDLINVKKLDQASIEIANEYLEQIAIEERSQKGNKDERPD